jgi:hypothetical protein
VRRHARRESRKGFRGSIHHVISSGTVDMHVNKARNNGELALIVPACGWRNGNFVAAAHSGDLSAIYQNNGIGDFLLRRQNATR